MKIRLLLILVLGVALGLTVGGALASRAAVPSTLSSRASINGTAPHLVPPGAAVAQGDPGEFRGKLKNYYLNLLLLYPFVKDYAAPDLGDRIKSGQAGVAGLSDADLIAIKSVLDRTPSVLSTPEKLVLLFKIQQSVGPTPQPGAVQELCSDIDKARAIEQFVDAAVAAAAFDGAGSGTGGGNNIGAGPVRTILQLLNEASKAAALTKEYNGDCDTLVEKAFVQRAIDASETKIVDHIDEAKTGILNGLGGGGINTPKVGGDGLSNVESNINSAVSRINSHVDDSVAAINSHSDSSSHDLNQHLDEAEWNILGLIDTSTTTIVNAIDTSTATINNSIDSATASIVALLKAQEDSFLIILTQLRRIDRQSNKPQLEVVKLAPNRLLIQATKGGGMIEDVEFPTIRVLDESSLKFREVTRDTTVTKVNKGVYVLEVSPAALGTDTTFSIFAKSGKRGKRTDILFDLDFAKNLAGQ